MGYVDLKPEEVLNKLRSEESARIFSENGVLAAYLFGSMASGKVHADSDVDVGVVFDDSVAIKDRTDRRIALILDLGHLLETNEMDVVPLNDAPPLLRFQVLKNKHLLYSANEQLRGEFEIKAFNEYFDFKPVLDEYSAAMRRRIKERGLR